MQTVRSPRAVRVTGPNLGIEALVRGDQRLRFLRSHQSRPRGKPADRQRRRTAAHQFDRSATGGSAHGRRARERRGIVTDLIIPKIDRQPYWIDHIALGCRTPRFTAIAKNNLRGSSRLSHAPPPSDFPSAPTSPGCPRVPGISGHGSGDGGAALHRPCRDPARQAHSDLGHGFDPGEQIRITFNGLSQETAAPADGRWLVWLKACPGSTERHDLQITGTNALVFHDLLIGDIWLCSGQSNMTFSVSRSDNAAAEIAAAEFPLIRQFAVAVATSDQPAVGMKGKWSVCSPATAGKYSAVGFYFAREVQRRTGVPIGILQSALGGTPIEAWMSRGRPHEPAGVSDRAGTLAAGRRRPAGEPSCLRRRPGPLERPGSGCAAKRARPGHVLSRRSPAAGGSSQYPCLFRSFRPLQWHDPPPASLRLLRGILWYQGESAIPDKPTSIMRCAFSAMIADWRKQFGQGELPFYWVNLPNFKGDSAGDSWARLREAQTQALSLPATGQAVAIDPGDPDNVHPTHKQEVGHRLALVAEANAYRMEIESIGPTFAGALPDGKTLDIHFVHMDGGLLARGGGVRSLEIAGIDGTFHPAEAAIAGDHLIATATAVAAPVAARYAWSNNSANLYGRSGLPAVPFSRFPDQDAGIAGSRPQLRVAPAGRVPPKPIGRSMRLFTPIPSRVWPELPAAVRQIARAERSRHTQYPSCLPEWCSTRPPSDRGII